MFSENLFKTLQSRNITETQMPNFSLLQVYLFLEPVKKEKYYSTNLLNYHSQNMVSLFASLSLAEGHH